MTVILNEENEVASEGRGDSKMYDYGEKRTQADSCQLMSRLGYLRLRFGQGLAVEICSSFFTSVLTLSIYDAT